MRTRHPRGRALLLGATGAALLAGAPGAADERYVPLASSFTPLGDLAGGTFRSVANGVSADGVVVVGEAMDANGLAAFRWTPASGMEALGDLPGGAVRSVAYAVSADGATIVGIGSSSASGDSYSEGFLWTSAGGMLGLGDLPGGWPASAARSVSADGSVVVGSTSTGSALFQACRWAPSGGGPGGPVALPDLAGGDDWSVAWDVSDDGGRIVGQGWGANGVLAADLSTSGATPLAAVPGAFASAALAVSGDGTVAVGHGMDSGGTHAVRWTPSGAEFLGDLPGGSDGSSALDCSRDGSVVVGYGTDDLGAAAFVWTPAGGMLPLRDVLRDLGVPGLGGWRLVRATGISADGRTVVGEGLNPAGETEAWVAHLGVALEPEFGFLPLSLRAKKDARKPARSRLDLTALADLGTDPADLSAPLTIRIGSLVLEAPAFSRGRKPVWTSTDGGLTVKLTPVADTSKVTVDLAFRGELRGVPTEGDLDLIAEGPSLSGWASATVRRGRYVLGPPEGDLAFPLIHLLAVRGSVPDAKPHSFRIAACLAGGVVPPPVPQDLRVVVGAFEQEIPASAFTTKRGRHQFSGAAPGITKVVVDFGSEAMTVDAKGISLGALAQGPNPVRVLVEYGKGRFDRTVLLARKKNALRY